MFTKMMPINQSVSLNNALQGDEGGDDDDIEAKKFLGVQRAIEKLEKMQKMFSARLEGMGEQLSSTMDMATAAIALSNTRGADRQADKAPVGDGGDAGAHSSDSDSDSDGGDVDADADARSSHRSSAASIAVHPSSTL